MIFKTNKNKNYVDVSICNKCNSNCIVYDIDFNDSVEELSKYSVIPQA